MWIEYASTFFIISQTKQFATQKKFRKSTRQVFEKTADSFKLAWQTVLKFLEILSFYIRGEWKAEKFQNFLRTKTWMPLLLWCIHSKFGYSVRKNSFKGLRIDCIQYSNIIRITYYSYSYSGTILNPNIIRIRIRPNICARILFVFVFAHSEKTNIIRIRIRSKFWFRIIFVFVFGPKNSIRSPLLQMTLFKLEFNRKCHGFKTKSEHSL